MFRSLMSRCAKNWRSGVTVSLVSIPLSISLAVASGTTPLAGILTAIWAGLIASLFAGSNFNIVGPTGALSGIIALYALGHGSASLGMLAIVSGVLVLIAYVLKLEKYLLFIPSSVIHGFTLGVALVIGLGQLNYALGLYGLPKHDTLIRNIWESFHHLTSVSWPTVAIFLVFSALLFTMRRWLPKIPGAIVLAPIGIVLGYMQKTGIVAIGFKTLGDLFGALPVQLVQLPTFSFEFSLISTGVTIALIAILETMLSARIADGMTKTKHHERKEMLALGLANIGSGLLGGIPATAALARTALNIKTGADHRISATINAVSIAVISLFLFSYFAYIPMAVIAAILMYTAINMVEKEHFIRFFRLDRTDFAISLLVAGITLFADPIMGIMTGAALSLLVFAHKHSQGQFTMSISQNASIKMLETFPEEQEAVQGLLVYSFKGGLSYLNARTHLSRFEQGLQIYETIVLRFREVSFIDIDGIEVVEEIISICENRGQRIAITSVPAAVHEVLAEHSVSFKKLHDAQLVFEKTTDAVHSISKR